MVLVILKVWNLRIRPRRPRPPWLVAKKTVRWLTNRRTLALHFPVSELIIHPSIHLLSLTSVQQEI